MPRGRFAEKDRIMGKLSHTDPGGKMRMVDVGAKPVQLRIASAGGQVSMSAEAIKQVRENTLKKGDVLAAARLAGIQAAKNTSTLIPLCHNLPLDQVKVDLEIHNNRISVIASARCTGKTGVEMEALCAVSAALLCIYDMAKAVDKNMIISNIRLLSKEKHDV